MSPDGPDEELPPGPSLDPSGRIVDAPQERAGAPTAKSGAAGADSRGDEREAEDARRFEPPRSDEEPLELEPLVRIEQPGVHPLPEPPPRTRRGLPLGWIAVLALVALVIAGGVWFGRKVTTPGVLIIRTVPSGADVIIDGIQVGQTPYATDNRYRIPAVPLELRHRGYLIWHGTFRGHFDQRLTIRLLRAPTPPPIPAANAR